MIRVRLKTSLSQSSGYGRDGIGLARALVRAGMEVTLTPTSVSPPIPLDVAQLLTVEPNPPFDMLIHHQPPEQLGLTRHEKESSYLQFAWSMWEYENFNAEMREAVGNRLTGYTAFLAYDETSEKAYRGTGTDTPIERLQGGYEPEQWVLPNGAPRRDWNDDTFVFVMAGDLSYRKNPYASLRAIQRLSDEGFNVRLRLKARHSRNLPAHLTEQFDVVDVFDGLWSDQRMRDFYAQAHCYVSSSWGEGKDLPALEAGTTGCALVLSDCGGHREWAMPVFSTLVGGTINRYDMAFVNVDDDALYHACRALVEDRQKARQMGTQASAIIPQTMSWDRVVRDLVTLHMNRSRAA